MCRLTSVLALAFTIVGCGTSASRPDIAADTQGDEVAVDVADAVGPADLVEVFDVRMSDTQDTADTEDTQDTIEPVCVLSTFCVTDGDCPVGAGIHCNTKLDPPVCQTLYCGDTGTACSEDALCASRLCVDDACCVPDCSGRQCGEDPACGMSCGTCDEGFVCDAGTCVDDCAGLACGLSPTLRKDCGACLPGKGCASGQCVKTGEMILILAGRFEMGCSENPDNACSYNEKPHHQVTLSAYFIDKTEVTQEELRVCVDAGACEMPACDWDLAEYNQKPAICVTWTQAAAYCAWTGKRLPTEAEWEYAARGSDGRVYPWGDNAPTCSLAVMDYDAYTCPISGVQPVCSTSPAGDSPFGLCDMAGNAWEWVADWYADEYTPGSAENPQGPPSVEYAYRVKRLGGFDSYDSGSSYFHTSIGFDYLRVSARNGGEPDTWGTALGFRCARSGE